MPAAAVIGWLARPKAIVWGGALVISGAIVANALFLQSTRHPAPFFAAERPAKPVPAKPDALVLALQDALRIAGYYGGPVDGLAGPQTSSAIVAFERIAGRDVTGRPSPELLEAVQAGSATRADNGSTAGAKLAPAAVPPPAADPRVALVQAALSRAAYAQIRADGVFGPQTSEAIKRFQEDHGLPVTGEIDDALLMQLTAAGALEGG